MARPRKPLRFEQTNMLIICDGKTEKNYFNYVIKQHLAKQKIAVKLDIHNFKQITETNNYIKRKPGTPPFDAVIFIKDLENSNLALKECENIAKFEGLSGKQKDKSYWFVFYNYPSIEYWYILHFEELMWTQCQGHILCFFKVCSSLILTKK